MSGFYNRTRTGVVTFQLTDSIVRLLGSYTINGSTTSGAIDIPQVTGGTPMYFCAFSADQATAQDTGRKVQLDGWRISWTGISEGTTIYYGVY